MISWENWQTLLAVYRAGTYAAAASALQVNATTIGRRIRHLEIRLGGSLFLRHDRRLVPTARCTAILANLEAASDSLREVEQQSDLELPGKIWRDVRITAAPFLIQSLLAPEIATISIDYQLRIELVGTGNNISLTRREADIALRLDDGQFPLGYHSEFVHQEPLCAVEFAVYAALKSEPQELPWAGIIEESTRSAGMLTMHKLADARDVRFKVKHFDALQEIVKSGAAKALLPVCMASRDTTLRQFGNTELAIPLWMLSHAQDLDVAHLQATRSWITNVTSSELARK